MPLTLLKLDKTGHSTFTGSVAEQQFHALIGRGYAMFKDDVQIRESQADAESEDISVLALAPLVGG